MRVLRVVNFSDKSSMVARRLLSKARKTDSTIIVGPSRDHGLGCKYPLIPALIILFLNSWSSVSAQEVVFDWVAGTGESNNEKGTDIGIDARNVRAGLTRGLWEG